MATVCAKTSSNRSRLRPPGRKPRRFAGHIQNRRLHANAGRAAIQHAGNAPAQVVQNVGGGGGAGVPKAVGAGRGNGRARRANKREGHRMIGHAQTHFVQPGGHIGRYAPPARERQRERAGPARLRQRPRLLGHARVAGSAKFLPSAIGHMHNDWVVERALLGLKNVGHRTGAERVCAQPIHGLGGEGGQPARADHLAASGGYPPCARAPSAKKAFNSCVFNINQFRILNSEFILYLIL